MKPHELEWFKSGLSHWALTKCKQDKPSAEQLMTDITDALQVFRTLNKHTAMMLSDFLEWEGPTYLMEMVLSKEWPKVGKHSNLEKEELVETRDAAKDLMTYLETYTMDPPEEGFIEILSDPEVTGGLVSRLNRLKQSLKGN